MNYEQFMRINFQEQMRLDDVHKINNDKIIQQNKVIYKIILINILH